MSTSTITYIAWPLTLGLAFAAGNMIDGNESSGANPEETKSPAKGLYNSATGSAEGVNSTRVGSRKTGANGFNKMADLTRLSMIDDDLERMTQLVTAIGGIGPGEFSEVLQGYLDSGLASERWAEMSILMKAWAKVDPEAALAFGAKSPDLKKFQDDVLAVWAGNAPDAAIQWVKTNFKGSRANDLMVGVITGIAKNDLSRATELLEALPFGSSRGRALFSVLPEVAKLGVDKAFEWAEGIKDEKLRKGAQANMVAQLADADPEATAKWVSTLEGGGRSMAIRALVGTWSRKDPEAASKWVDALTGGERLAAAKRLVGNYARQSPEKAVAWLDGFKGQPEHKSLVKSFVDFSSFNNPQLALTQTQHLDAKDQESSRNRILRMWNMMEPEAAGNWMTAQNMTSEQQKEITDMNQSMMMQAGSMEDVRALLDTFKGSGAVIEGDSFIGGIPEGALQGDGSGIFMQSFPKGIAGEKPKVAPVPKGDSGVEHN